MFSLWKHSASMKFLEFVCENLLLLGVSKYKEIQEPDRKCMFPSSFTGRKSAFFFCSVGGGGGGGGGGGTTVSQWIWHPRKFGTPMPNILGNVAPPCRIS